MPHSICAMKLVSSTSSFNLSNSFLVTRIFPIHAPLTFFPCDSRFSILQFSTLSLLPIALPPTSAFLQHKCSLFPSTKGWQMFSNFRPKFDSNITRTFSAPHYNSSIIRTHNTLKTMRACFLHFVKVLLNSFPIHFKPWHVPKNYFLLASVFAISCDLNSPTKSLHLSVLCFLTSLVIRTSCQRSLSVGTVSSLTFHSFNLEIQVTHKLKSSTVQWSGSSHCFYLLFRSIVGQLNGLLMTLHDKNFFRRHGVLFSFPHASHPDPSFLSAQSNNNSKKHSQIGILLLIAQHKLLLLSAIVGFFC